MNYYHQTIRFLSPGAIFFGANTSNILIIAFTFANLEHISLHFTLCLSIINMILITLSLESRNLLLGKHFTYHELLGKRLILLPLIAIIAYFLGSLTTHYSRLIIALIVIRKCLEWLSEINLTLNEVKRKHDKDFKNFIYLFGDGLILTIIMIYLFGYSFEYNTLLLLLSFWAIYPLYSFLFNKFPHVRNILNVKYKNFIVLSPLIVSSILLSGYVVFFRYMVSIFSQDEFVAGNFLTSILLGSILTAVFTGPFGSKWANNTKNLHAHLKIIPVLSIPPLLIIFLLNDELIFMNKNYYFWQTVLFTMSGSILMSYSQLLRHKYIQNRKSPVAKDIVSVILLVIYLCIFIDHSLMMSCVYLINSIVAIAIYHKESWLIDIKK